jgi:hypothetical protein
MERPPLKSRHQATGWSKPIVPPAIAGRVAPEGWRSNGFSTTVARTCEVPRTFLSKLYQRSVRVQYSGSALAAGWTRSATLTVAAWASVSPVARAPSRSVRNCQLSSVWIAEWTPTKPPPSWKYCSKLACWASVSTSPVVFRKMTAR